MNANTAQALDRRPLVAHIVFRFDYGGLENGVINIVNGLPENAFRHAIVALTEASEFQNRLRRPDVSVYALRKQAGKDPGAYLRLFQLLRTLRPTVVHTRNLGTLEGALVARLAGVPCRIHGEHGWDVHDVDGNSRKYRTLRKLINPAINRFVAVSHELERWLTERVGIAPMKVVRICNGVDTERFRPTADRPRTLLPSDRFPPGTVAIGSVTRFSAIKDPLNLVRAFIAARADPAGRFLRLVMVGDGALRADAEALLRDAGADAAAWLPGSRDDIPQLLREFDIFVLGSLREGISNTILEAMATGLPVIATATGGNLELVQDDVSGRLVTPGDPKDLAQALLGYVNNSAMRVAHGRAARRRIEEEFSLIRMLADYEALYRAHCNQSRQAA